MVRSWVTRFAGVRTAWRVIGDGDFFCAACGGDRCYQRLAGRRRLTVLGVPVARRGDAEPVVECSSCHGRFLATALDVPTTTQLAGLLRDAVHTIALAVLGTDGQAVAARKAAVASIRAAGFPDCTHERLLTLQAALAADTLPLWESLTALAPHLEAPGREALVLHGAGIALADGPYSPTERTILTLIGEALRLLPSETERLLSAAATDASRP
ncbi:TerB family tellurite resistance protein [Streptomyces sp. DSM 44917]|uniref:TerB family tellurite resistance protein n=1 Tax=Streptomyces boetiae TaxID=3075541 RepID=A0ABU2L831_9ACTN|nr:TerB family tellurite resistance protein [Streptomyces sp. DSM 44917]MDT0307453.1 TerB family tellurite resistance protein [Streptomyces sp. DSM 44917]